MTIPNAVAGQRYYIQVQGADSTAFSTGDYALGLSFNGASAPPTEPSPIIVYPNGTPLHSGGGSAQARATQRRPDRLAAEHPGHQPRHRRQQ